MPLSDVRCRNVVPTKKPQKIADGGGLFLYVTPTGGRLWRLSYRFAGRQKTLALGAYPTVGLKEARSKREDAKLLLKEGIDPGEAKKAEKNRHRSDAGHSFESLARRWFEDRRGRWSAAYSDRLLRRLEADIFPAIGQKPIQSIEPPELLAVVRRVEQRGAVELAKRLLQVCGQVFRYAVASGVAVRDPSQDLRGALKSPGPAKHRAALNIQIGSRGKAWSRFPTRGRCLSLV